MRRAFLHISALTRSRKKDATELKSTLSFLARGADASKTLANLLDAKLNGDSSTGSISAPSEKKHVDNVLKVLNATLPNEKVSAKRVQDHYDVFFHQLKALVQRIPQATATSVNRKAGTRSTENVDLLSRQVDYKHLTGEELYQRLMLLHLMHKLTTVEMIKIILSKQFDQVTKLKDNMSLFAPEVRLDISILLFYRTHDAELWNTYYAMWVEHFSSLSIPMKRLFWRCVYHRGEVEDTIALLPDWNINELVVMYQSLFKNANLLPIYHDTIPVSKSNCDLFMRTLRLLSSQDPQYESYLVKVVKLSIEAKISDATEMSIQRQYKFTTSLHLVLHDLYNKTKSTSLQAEIQDIFLRIDREEKDLKTQMSLKFT
ncbi:Smt1p KNAG_0C02550 [Huiozyma naganishii CBS 8797]|uniref:Uncharacterized protein n=1 Tax=Huiozyma naganishii (strain ATCC MYA-139 / BCRC 22969 / CBS 8797 / KCTC 17520 / NBRC 10181 / NCYC 3082 / Yp74L-3) TaxID=1071383 RepID=J7S5T6_HUIN7|nr:hypothetical protein KNAG_0C02550 [Kazachstania naganishii CBS 8797]CCK69366.1 hypothetical protein KNAG_0C02550 [Kazachstania naganishii CBS 8797]